MGYIDRSRAWLAGPLLASLLTACSAPPSAPTLTLSFGFKQLQFHWSPVENADRYRLLVDLQGSANFAQIGEDLSAATTSMTLPIAVHLLPWDTARYVVEACNADGCARSEGLSPSDGELATVGYVKASNTDVDDQFAGGSVIYGLSAALSRDGRTMVASALFEDGAATGINGDGSDNSALDAGAAYVFGLGDSGWEEEAYLKASNAESSDQFGYSVTISGDGNTVAVSANLEASSATGINGDQSDNSMLGAGAVYVFVRREGNWEQQAYVKASNTEASDVFGYQIALSYDGDTLVATAQGEDSASPGINLDESNNDAPGSGAAYVFVRDGEDWSQQAYIKAENPEGNDLFGSSVSISDDGNTFVVGALDEDGGVPGVDGDQTDNSGRGSGVAYVFSRDRELWIQEGYIKGLNTAAADAFGAAVSLSADGNTLAVGAPDENNTATGANAEPDHRVGFDPRTDYSNGSAYVFFRESGIWSQQAYLKPSHIGQFDQFGTRVALNGDGNLLAVGVPLEDSPAVGINGDRGNDDEGGTEYGAVYLYARNDGTWVDHNYVKAPNAGVYDEFGSVVALSDDGTTMIVGARFEDSAATGFGGDQGNEDARDSGALYIY